MDAFDADGKPIEGALNPEEVEKKLDETKKKVKEELQKEITKQKTKAEELEEKIEDYEEEMDKAGDKDYNWKRLKRAKKDLEKKLKRERERTDKKITDVKQSLRKEEIEKNIKDLSDGDDELAKKIRFHYDVLTHGEQRVNTKSSSIKERLEDAYTLATGSKPTSSLTGGHISSKGGKTPSGAGKTGKISDDVKDMGKKVLGLTDEDYKRAE